MTDAEHLEGCPLCGREVHTDEPPGGWVYRDRWWSLGMLPGVEVPGWLVLQARRHVEALWEIEDAGVAALGLVLSHASRALSDTLGAERVYLTAFGEGISHWHMLLAARPGDTQPDSRGAKLILAHADFVDADTATEVAGAVRTSLSRALPARAVT
jgi:diadenosine tetraphosphate (Ap4A) HIT family hydrolase